MTNYPGSISTAAGKAERGSVLLISLVFLLILTLGATTAMRTSSLGLKMANNEEIRVTTMEMTQSIIDQVVGNPDNLIVAGGVGWIN